MSAAVMPMRKVVSAPAMPGSPTRSAATSSVSAALANPLPDFPVLIAINSFSALVAISYAFSCNACANDGGFSPNCHWQFNSLWAPRRGAADAYSAINLAGYAPNMPECSEAFAQRSLVHARPPFDPDCHYRARHRHRPAHNDRTSRDGGAVRDFDGGYSADARPAGSWRGRLSVHRLYDLRPAGGLGDGCVGSARQIDTGARHRMESRRQGQDQMAIYAAPEREIP